MSHNFAIITYFKHHRKCYCCEGVNQQLVWLNFYANVLYFQSCIPFSDIDNHIIANILKSWNCIFATFQKKQKADFLSCKYVIWLKQLHSGSEYDRKCNPITSLMFHFQYAGIQSDVMRPFFRNFVYVSAFCLYYIVDNINQR